MLLQFRPLWKTSSVSLSTTPAGIERRVAPLSRSARQPSRHPTLSNAEALKASCSSSSCCSTAWNMPASAGAAASSSLAGASRKPKRTLRRSTDHSCGRPTGTRWKSSGCWATLVSFQTTYPGDRGSFCRQIENILSRVPSSTAGWSLNHCAFSANDHALSLSVWLTSPSAPRLVAKSCALLFASRQASNLGTSGGPTPMMAWKSEALSTGIDARCTCQKLWFSLYGPISSWSMAAVVSSTPLPNLSMEEACPCWYHGLLVLS
mmetsp:Transcript_43223/g.112490  ORF Transcript_43223/g.112490 Transcript_43223/m.112490 type:complete len:263 (+) Transcript_43223:481-1269(+)